MTTATSFRARYEKTQTTIGKLGNFTTAIVATLLAAFLPVPLTVLLNYAGLAAMLYLAYKTSTRPDDTITVDDHHVTVENTGEIDRKEFTTYLIENTASSAKIHISGNNSTHSFEFATEQQARAFGHALSLEEDQRSLEYEVRAAFPNIKLEELFVPVGMLLGWVVQLSDTVPHAVILCGLVMLGLAAARLKSTVKIGCDGIELQHRGKNRFISYASIAEVEPNERSIKLSLLDGSVVYVPVTNFTFKRDLPEQQLMVGKVFNAIMDRLEHSKANRNAKHIPLTRNGRSGEEWLAHLRATLAKSASFRELPLDPNELWNLLEDPTQNEEEVAAAAATLSASLSEEQRVRVRAVSERVASSKLRVVLDCVAENDDKGLVRALDEVAPLSTQNA